MNNFPNPPLDNIAGIASFNFVEVEKVNSIPFVINNKITSSIVLKDGYLWFKGYSSIDSLEYSEPIKQSNHGNFIEAELKGFVPESPEILQLFTKMDGRRFILHLTDNDNLKKIAGTIEQPLTFLCDFETQTVSGNKGYKYHFKGLLTKRAPIYTAADPTTMPDDNPQESSSI